jgi:hypothetical protein
MMRIGTTLTVTTTVLTAVLGYANSGQCTPGRTIISADHAFSAPGSGNISVTTERPTGADKLASNDNDETSGCKDGDVITVSGEVGNIWVNKAGTWSIGVAHVVPNCLSPQWLIVSKTRPPRSCSKGVRLSARVRITETPLIGFDQDKLIELTCE